MLFGEIKEKPLDFFLLLLILLAGLILFFLSPIGHPRRRVIYAVSAAYLFWSLFYHYRRGDLTFSIMVEYLLFALFALVLISSTLF